MIRKISIPLVIVLFLFPVFQSAAQTENDDGYNITSIRPQGNQAPEENFTGTVWVNLVLTGEDDLNSVAGKVTFEAKARTNWHSHPGGQILIVTDGVGYYQERGKPIQSIREGDVVKIPIDADHWHGASHNSSMTHTAIVPNIDAGSTEWLGPVTDEEYNSDRSDASMKSIQPELIEEASDNLEELWPNYESKAAETDPELYEVFNNWTFGEVANFGDVDDRIRTMVILASNIASQALTEYKKYVSAALNVGVTPVEIKEILYQSVPYVGMAKVVDFISATNEVFRERGIDLPLEGQSTTTRENRHEKGLEIMVESFGQRIIENRENAPDGQEHIQEYLAGNCFGDYYTRDGLDMPTRELLTYSMLISMGGTESQVRGHIQGNVNVGNDKEKLIAVTTQLLPYIGYPRTLNAIQGINNVLPE